MMTVRNRRFSGFTLIELLIVVAIIAILAAIAVPNFLEAQTRSKVSRSKADQRTLATALEAYAVDNNNRYPPCIYPVEVILGQPTECTPGAGGAPYPARVQRLAWLTTPVAFITSVLSDPFSTGIYEPPGSCPAANIVNTKTPAMTYWDPAYADSTKASSVGPTRYADQPDFLRARGQWVLLSFGPDKDFEPAASWSPATAPGWPPYDSTNGTISNGDIYRIKQ